MTNPGRPWPAGCPGPSPAIPESWRRPDAPPAVTDDPMPEVAEVGHDRTVINLKSEWLDTWLNPDPEHMDELQMAMDDPQRPYY